MTSAALGGLDKYGQTENRPPSMKCFKNKCYRQGSKTVTLLFYLKEGTVPATLTPLGVLLCAICAGDAKVEDFVCDEGWEQIGAAFDQYELTRPDRSLTVLRVQDLE